MNLPLKILTVIGGLFVLALVLGISWFSSLFSDMCGNTISSVTKSPDQQWKVVVFERNCGATTDFSTQISILRNDRELPNSHGNIFTADSGNGEAEINEQGIIYVEPRWIDSRTLLIEYDSAATVYDQDERFQGISIRYLKVKAEV